MVIKSRVVAFEGAALLEKGFHRDGKELRRILGAIGIDQGRYAVCNGSGVGLVSGLKIAGPAVMVVPLVEQGRAIGDAGLRIEPVGKFVDNNIDPIRRIPGTVFGLILGKNNRTPSPAFASAGFLVFAHDISVPTGHPTAIGAGIEVDR